MDWATIGSVAANNAGGIIGAIGNITTQAMANSANRKAVEATNQANLDLAKYSYEQQQLMLDRQNAYNSPAAQMQRYRDAGLNPNMIYGQITPGNQTEIAKYQSPNIETKRYQPIDIAAAVNTLSAIRQNKAMADEAANRAKLSQLQLNWQKYLTNFGGDISQSPLALNYQSQIQNRQTSMRNVENIISWRDRLNVLSESQKKYYNDHIQPLQSALMQNRIDLANKQYQLAKDKFGVQQAQFMMRLALDQTRLHLQERGLSLQNLRLNFEKGKFVYERMDKDRNYFQRQSMFDRSMRFQTSQLISRVGLDVMKQALQLATKSSPVAPLQSGRTAYDDEFDARWFNY